ncbi:LysE family translocator [Corynebacterium pseudopelargi]|uniref:Threonine efflux protein n=1 Tax=Corynebacterium pseudopelargi TaxID=2080757 RepID=A0A3G6ISX0_9CORY|nr:LysE family translocator [Corynebacterium pseudopelargi]AZA08755.1 Threonine efflux protein [Corynebacterium pseudopelargi]
MELNQIATLVTLYLAGMISPGPDIFLVMRVATKSRKHGLATVAGIVTGLAVWVTLTVTGASALLTAYPSILSAIQLLGGAWIGYMGVQMLREAREQFKADARIDLKLEGVLGSPWRSYRQGLLTNLANPKALLYFAAVIAPFLPPNPSLGLSVELIFVLLFTALIGFGLIALAVGSKFLRKRMVKAGPYIDGVAGAFFVFAAIALMIAGIRGFF